MKNIKILAIETSCDETSAAIVCGANSNNQETRNKQISNSKFQIPKILSNVVSSQADLHAKTGGVVPEVASRAHMESIMPVVEQALKKSISNFQFPISKQNPNSKSKISKFENSVIENSLKIKNYKIENLLSEITHIAVTAGPGLIGSLLVGFNAAKAIAAARNLPLIAVDHIEGHIYSAFGGEFQNPNAKCQKFENCKIENFPILALTVSGGHTSLTLMHDHGKYQTIGETIDDAAGEAFDKVAKLLGLNYPGGPEVSRLAENYRRKMSNVKYQMPNEIGENPNVKCQIKFPRPLLNQPNFDFSFSGLKTAVLTEVKNRLKNRRTEELKNEEKEEICFAFEEAAVEVLVTKTLRAVKKYNPKAVILAGGVAANKRLREQLAYELKIENCKLKIDFLMPPMELCGDNAAMIGIAAYFHILKNEVGDWRTAKVDSNLEL